MDGGEGKDPGKRFGEKESAELAERYIARGERARVRVEEQEAEIAA